MPVVWAANLLGENLPDRVYGPELMERYCGRSVERGLRVWLYGGRDQGALLQLALNVAGSPGHQGRGGLLAPLPADERGGGGRLVGARSTGTALT